MTEVFIGSSRTQGKIERMVWTVAYSLMSNKKMLIATDYQIKFYSDTLKKYFPKLKFCIVKQGIEIPKFDKKRVKEIMDTCVLADIVAAHKLIGK